MLSSADVGPDEAGPVQLAVAQKLRNQLMALEIQIVNESHRHNVPKGSESHLKVMVVSPLFEGKPLLQRHRMVNSTLAEELEGPIHALSIVAKTPEQWQQEVSMLPDGVTPGMHPMPACRGGNKL
eukprot:CAMPEP_0113934284 /NCGR_PEP_ID=MMETSP1339-20121228/1627_1 /TAXON_ID=94617 /ORGANISM="Fibrocapsa japonica" /LENGTH=124 /DNA_ID=CAMNT_0000936017 /DNA_START=168 /DNA_END=542 /DNA_ORIENTATION=+ /assembly_acc=CAM_ASM_000762